MESPSRQHRLSGSLPWGSVKHIVTQRIGLSFPRRQNARGIGPTVPGPIPRFTTLFEGRLPFITTHPDVGQIHFAPLHDLGIGGVSWCEKHWPSESMDGAQIYDSLI